MSESRNLSDFFLVAICVCTESFFKTCLFTGSWFLYLPVTECMNMLWLFWFFRFVRIFRCFWFFWSVWNRRILLSMISRVVWFTWLTWFVVCSQVLQLVLLCCCFRQLFFHLQPKLLFQRVRLRLSCRQRLPEPLSLRHGFRHL